MRVVMIFTTLADSVRFRINSGRGYSAKRRRLLELTAESGGRFHLPNFGTRRQHAVHGWSWCRG